MSKVSDSDLDAAALETEELAEETPAEETEELNEEEKEEEGAEEQETEEEAEEEVEAEPEDNATRSRLGRKHAKLEADVATLTAKMDRFFDNQNKTEEPEIDADMPVTFGEMKEFLEKQKKDEERDNVQYNSDYIKHTSELVDEVEEDETTIDAVLKEMDANYNKIYSKDAGRDAEKNFNKAYRSVLKRAKASKNPLKGKPPAVPSKTTGGERVKAKEAELPELDPYAKEYIEKMGMDEDSVNRALTKNLPTYLRR